MSSSAVSRATIVPVGPRDWAGLPRTVALIYLLGFALALVVYGLAWRDAPVLDGDSGQYLEVAADLADGRLDELHLRTPGYPLLLALTGSSHAPTRALFWTSLVLHFATVWMLGWALQRAGAPRGVVLALAALLLLPLYVEPAAYVMTENLAQFALAAGVTCTVGWRSRGHLGWVLTAGVALSFAAVVRPVYQLVVPLFCVLLVLPIVSGRAARPAHFRASAAMLLLWISIVGGVATFNWLRFQWFGLGPSAGFHLSTRTVLLLERLPDEYAEVREILINERDRQLVQRGGTHTGTQAIWSVREELGQVTGLSQPELSRFLIRMNLVLISKAPLEYLQEVAKSVPLYWFPATTRLSAMDSSALRWLWTLVHFAVVGLFAIQVMGWISLWSRWTRPAVDQQPAFDDLQTFASVFAMAVILYTMVLCCFMDIGEPRQRRSTDAVIVFATLLGVAARRPHSREVAGEVGHS